MFIKRIKIFEILQLDNFLLASSRPTAAQQTTLGGERRRPQIPGRNFSRVIFIAAFV